MGTLTLEEDPTGLLAVADIADTQAGRDLRTLVDRGDLSQMSFAFRVLDDEWDVDEDDNLTRTITKVRELFDVSPVTYPAYPDTSLEQPRSLRSDFSPTPPEPESPASAEERGSEAEEVVNAGEEDALMSTARAQRRIRLRERAMRLAA